MSSALLTHPRFVGHELPGHPESPERMRAIWHSLKHTGISDRMIQVTPTPASDEAILRAHSPEFLALLQRVSREYPQQIVMLDQDTWLAPGSLQVARLAAGACLHAVDIVLTGEADNALVVARPPGHHACPGAAMGFCLFGNVAMAALHACAVNGLESVMIVDLDVHHGNGSQDILYSDGRVGFLSIHQSPLYPGTGAALETGAGPGWGYTANIPLRAGHGDASYRALFESLLWPLARRWQPQLVLVSLGFDAHHADPLANMRLTLAGYDWMVRELLALAQDLCDGRVVFVLEGGYQLEVLAHGVQNLAHRLLGEEGFSDPFDNGNLRTRSDSQDVIKRIRRIHAI
ncbi:MAG: histone deacetylase [Anaerolineaceae bacterium]|nr:histone deacetylase [Anaerolineaceae bacterium]